MAKALARAKQLGKEVVLSLKENSAIQEGRPPLPDHTSLMPPRSMLLVQTSANRLTLLLLQVVEVLKMLGCSQDILDSVKSKVDEKTKTQHTVPGEKERMLHVLKMKLTKAKAPLAHLEGIEKKKEEEFCNARDQVLAQEKDLSDILTQHDVLALPRVMDWELRIHRKTENCPERCPRMTLILC